MTMHQAKGVIFVHTVIFTVAITVGLLSLFVTPVSVQDTGAKAPTAQVDDRDGTEFCDLTVVECGSEPAVEEKVSMAKPKTPTQSRQQAVQAPKRGIERIIKKNATKAMQAKVDYAWELSHDKDFVLMIEAESSFNEYAVNINRDGSRDLGISQINTRWHKKIVNDKKFKNWKFQMEKGYELYQNGTTFYGFRVRHKVANRFEYQLAKQ